MRRVISDLVSNDPERRQGNPATGEARGITMRYVKECPNGKAEEAETVAHSRLSNHRMKEEWFEADEAHAVATVD